MPIPQGLPHPPNRLPLIGDVKLGDLITPTQRLAAQAKELGSIFEQNVFGYPVVVIAGTDLIEEVNDEEHWEKHIGHTLRKLRPVVGDGLFTASRRNPNWAKAHNILVPAFTKTALINYHDNIKAPVRELVEYWAERSAAHEWADVSTDSNRLTLEIITRAGFSRSFDAIRGRRDTSFIEAALRELTFANRKTDTLPIFEKLFLRKRSRQHERDVEYAHQVVDQIIKERREEGAGRENDILDLMLNTTDPDTGEALDDANIRNQILTFLVAGSETSANVVSFALHYLSTNPQIADRARAEVDERWPERGFPDIQYEDVAKLRYLKRVADETLRLWPVAPGYFRQAKHDTSIGGGKYRFQHKDWVFVLLQAAHRDPLAWGPDAEQFNPDRFLAENLRKLPQRTYSPFGTGERACIGRQFAYHEIVLALAAIVHQFELEPDPDYTLKVSEHPTLKPAGLRLRLKQRSNTTV